MVKRETSKKGLKACNLKKRPVPKTTPLTTTPPRNLKKRPVPKTSPLKTTPPPKMFKFELN